MIKNFYRKALAIFTMIILLVLPTSVMAAGPIEPTGTQGPIGVQGEIGPTVTTGPIEPVGPQENEPLASATEAGDDDLTDLSQSPITTTSLPEQGLEATRNSSEENNININTEDNASTENQSQIDADTGNNDIGSNTIVGNVTTGNINSTETVVNASNTDLDLGSSIGVQNINPDGINQIELMPSGQRILFENQTTGPNSENTNELNNNNSVEIIDTNNAQIENVIEIDVNTGENSIANNTMAGNLTTGDINLGVNLVNLANLQMPKLILSADIWNILGSLNGNLILDPSFSNTKTGPNSLNSNLLNNGSDFSADIDQNADLSNLFNYHANTGENTIGNNTIIGNIQTGNTNIQNSVYNLVNITETPMYYILNVFGTWTGKLIGVDPNRVIINQVNKKTGANSSNQNAVNNNSNYEVSIENNAQVENKINIEANTGRNTVSNNTMVGDIKTGAITISANVINFVNSISEKTGKFALGIINIFGDWNGNAKAKDESNGEKNPDKKVSKNKKPKIAKLLETEIVLGEKIAETVNSFAGINRTPELGKEEDKIVTLPETGGLNKTLNAPIPENTGQKLWLYVFSAVGLMLISSWAFSEIYAKKNK